MDQTNEAPRAEEIIAAIYGRMSRLRERGSTPSAIVLPRSYYHIIQEYRGRLGDSPQGMPDYLGRYELFGVPLYTDSGTDIVIRATTVT